MGPWKLLLSICSTEKAPGMFFTLVIALPSEHTGGDVIVQHGDDIHTLQTQGLYDFGYSYLAWYADVNQSVSKVETWYLLVLTYNLMQQLMLTPVIYLRCWMTTSRTWTKF